MSLGLQDFEGGWRIAREIRDHAGQRTAHLEGAATFRAEGPLLVYEERGELWLNGTAMQAEQTHLWRRDGGRILVSFADGRPFHWFEPGVVRPGARHDCPPDTYLVAYDFSAWPVWSSEWDVTGPRKTYRMWTEYRRG